MVNSNERFGQARLKHEWANIHIRQLQVAWEAFLKTDFCELTVEDQSDGRGQQIRITSVHPLPAELVLRIGDAIHNLKSALDFTISEILGWKDLRLTFPMSETREELVASFRTNGGTPCAACGRGGKGKGRNAAIELVAPGIGEFIVETIQPYKSAGGFLWPLNKLDVRDKHRLLIPVLVPQTIKGINAVDANENRVMGCSATVGPGGTCATFGLGYGLKIESYGKPTADIFFNEVGIIENARVFPTLLNMSQAVGETITSLEAFCTS